MIRTLVLSIAVMIPGSGVAQSDPWAALRVFEGKWEGPVLGQPVYEAKSPGAKPQIHEDLGFFSYGTSLKKFVMGSTAMSGSCARSHDRTRASGVGLVGSLRTPASTRYFTTYPSTLSDGHEKALLRTREQPVDGALVLWSRAPHETIVATIKTLDLEFLPRFDTVHLP
jgi:hypothetical protein